MSKNDFLYALRDDLPDDFSESLRAQLEQVEDQSPVIEVTAQPETGRQQQGNRWLLAVASFVVALAGLIFLLSTDQQDDVARNILQIPPSLTHYGDLNPQTVSQLQPITTLGDGVAYTMTLSPDGEMLAVSGVNSVYLHDPYDLQAEPRRVATDDYLRVLELTDDGILYGTTSDYEAGQLTLLQLDTTSGETQVMLELSSVMTRQIHFSSTGNRLVLVTCNAEMDTVNCADDDYQLQVYDAETGDLGFSLPLMKPDFPLALSDDGQSLIYGIFEERQFNLYHLDLQNGQTQMILRRQSPIQYNWLKISPDNQYLLLQHSNHIMQYPLELLLNADDVIDFDDRQIDGISRSNFVGNQRQQAAFHPDGNRLMIPASNSFYIYDLTTRDTEIVQTDFPDSDLNASWDFLADGETIISISGARAISRYRFPDGTREDILYRYTSPNGQDFAFRSDTDLLTFGGLPFGSTYIRQWSLDTDEPTMTMFSNVLDEPYLIHGTLALSPNGRYLFYTEATEYSVMDSPNKWIHDFETGERHSVINFYANFFVDFLDEDTLLGTGGASTVYFYDVAQRVTDDTEDSDDVTVSNVPGELISNSWYSNGDMITTSADGSTMATLPCYALNAADGVNDYCKGKVAVWDAMTGQPRYQLFDESWQAAINVSLSGDGETLFVTVCNPTDSLANCDSLYIYDLSSIVVEDESDDIPEIAVEPVARISDFVHNVYHTTLQPGTDDDLLIAASGYSLTTFFTLDEDFTVEQQATFPLGEVAFSPNGDLVFGMNQQGVIEVWGVPPRTAPSSETTTANAPTLQLESRSEITGTTLSKTEIIASYGNGVALDMALSPDNATLAIATTDGIYLHDAYDLNAATTLIGKPAGDGRLYLEYADDGRLFMVTDDRIGDTTAVHVYDGDAGEFNILYQDQRPQSSRLIIQALDLSPDGNRLMIAGCVSSEGAFFQNGRAFCSQSAVARIDLIDFVNPDNSVVITLPGAFNAITAMTDDWSYLAYYGDAGIQLVDMATGAVQQIFEIPLFSEFDSNFVYPTHERFDMHFTPDGEELAIFTSSTGRLQTWSIDELQTIDAASPDVFSTDGSGVSDFGITPVAFHPISGEHVIGRADSLTVFTSDNESLPIFRNVYQPENIIVSNDGERVYVLTQSDTVQVFDYDSRDMQSINADYTLNGGQPVAMSEDGSLLVAYSSPYKPDPAFVWEISDDGITQQLLLPDVEASSPVYRAAISPDNRYIAYIQGNYVKVYDRQQDEHRQLDTVFRAVDLVFREDGSLVLITIQSGYGIRKIFDTQQLATGDVPYPYDGERIEDFVVYQYSSVIVSSPVQNFQIAPDGNTLAVGRCGAAIPLTGGLDCDHSPSVLVMDTDTTETLAILDDFLDEDTRVTEIAYSQDGAYLAVSTCADLIPQGWDCQSDASEVRLYAIDNLRAGEITPLITLTDMPLPGQFDMRLHRQSDGTFLLMTTAWESYTENTSRQVTRVWHVGDDVAMVEVYDVVAPQLVLSPDGRYMLEMEEGRLRFRVLPLE